ncbi:MAG: hypothetical protein D4R84_06755 [Rhodocyclaceae bacterium]|nr:MAG: hypothetical protein D4R84_06755 [Rhodocyclaceae bacterium]
MKNPGTIYAGIATGIVVAIVFVLALAGPFNLLGSRLPDGLYGQSASHWQAGQPADCWLCPARLFIVICDADKQVHIRSLQQLASLQADYLKDIQWWNMERGDDYYSCIGKRSFRLGRNSGSYGSPYVEGEPGFRVDVSFQVVEESAARQIVEVRYKDSMVDIDNSLFRYEVRDGTIQPLESWTVTKGHRSLAIFGVIAVLALLLLSWVLYFVIAVLLRFVKSRRPGPAG